VNVERVLQFTVWWYLARGTPFGMDMARNGAYIIQDLSGFGWKHIDIKFQRRMIELYQDNFPLRFHKTLELNSPMIMKMVWMVFRPFLKKKIVERFHQGERGDILEEVEKDMLWEDYGGNLKYDEDQFISDIKEYHNWYAKKLIEKENELTIRNSESVALAEVRKRDHTHRHKDESVKRTTKLTHSGRHGKRKSDPEPNSVVETMSEPHTIPLSAPEEPQPTKIIRTGRHSHRSSKMGQTAETIPLRMTTVIEPSAIGPSSMNANPQILHEVHIAE
jgi:hypothetical protein